MILIWFMVQGNGFKISSKNPLKLQPLADTFIQVSVYYQLDSCKQPDGGNEM
ncbi:Uncharacterized protein DAT39_005372 [Clarias magur]|uniref:Uncharacterized protein n=1 Tax=Clarias magur TaxID=1594786 RepID=A0A8J4UB65_CLAMG|nr:Uncharacterized protein DAT39_005372 [Clarias magur]